MKPLNYKKAVLKIGDQVIGTFDGITINVTQPVLFDPETLAGIRVEDFSVPVPITANLTISPAGLELLRPWWKCRTCRHRGRDFRTIVYDTLDGIEYDVECPKCESTEVDEA